MSLNIILQLAVVDVENKTYADVSCIGILIQTVDSSWKAGENSIRNQTMLDKKQYCNVNSTTLILNYIKIVNIVN